MAYLTPRSSRASQISGLAEAPSARKTTSLPAFAGALLLVAVDRDLGRVHVQHHALGRIEGLGPGKQLPIDCGQTGEVLVLGQQLVSNDCNREVRAAPRSQIFSEPIRGKVGSCESRSALFTSS